MYGIHSECRNHCTELEATLPLPRNPTEFDDFLNAVKTLGVSQDFFVKIKSKKAYDPSQIDDGTPGIPLDGYSRPDGFQRFSTDEPIPYLPWTADNNQQQSSGYLNSVWGLPYLFWTSSDPANTGFKQGPATGSNAPVSSTICQKTLREGQ